MFRRLALLLAHLLDALLSNGFEGIIGFIEEIIIVAIAIAVGIGIFSCWASSYSSFLGGGIIILVSVLLEDGVRLGFHLDHFLGFCETFLLLELFVLIHLFGLGCGMVCGSGGCSIWVILLGGTVCVLLFQFGH